MLAEQKERDPAKVVSLEVRVRGRVQGVGFRPTVWRHSRALGLRGEVFNDSEGVFIRLWGAEQQITIFLDRLRQEPPVLARIDSIECTEGRGDMPADFRIAPSMEGRAHTQIAPDAAICRACAAEILNSRERRANYPFTNCTHCGPRLTIVTGIPYDRANTTMAPFPMCAACEAEYTDPGDRRFHAEAIACGACGPRIALRRLDGHAPDLEKLSGEECLATAHRLIMSGAILALKGLGGYHLACDATNFDAVSRLRRLKRRDAKPFALMARDLGVIRDYCAVGEEEERLLISSAAPIVLLNTRGGKRLPPVVAPSLNALGFMLPTTPLHLLVMQGFAGPLVMTSGNLSDEPQAIDDNDARERLAAIASHALVHDRRIANRVDDSVVRVMAGRARVLRRARGYAPAPLRLPSGFESAPPLLAFGGELKAAFCLLKDGEATLSQHQGDLEDERTIDDYRKNLGLYARLFDHRPAAFIVDSHPDYVSTKFAREQGLATSMPVMEAQHHHAHVAACLAENGRPLDAPPVLGVVLDGLGFGDDGTIWGGEFLLADYRGYQRLGALRPVPMPGGAQAVREPWRNLYAHLAALMDWPEFARHFSQLDLCAELSKRQLPTLEAMMRSGVNSPMASSCGRLFDAVAAALDICPDRQAYEGETGARLEAIVDESELRNGDEAHCYSFSLSLRRPAGPQYLEPATMWRALLDDLMTRAPPPIIAARFHKGLAAAIVAMTKQLAQKDSVRARLFDTVALSGGCFQNQILFAEVLRRLEQADFKVLTHAEVPTNDGGLALGQAAIGGARLIDEAKRHSLNGGVRVAGA
ncbi:MAG: carbamoyltransferase HypF [Methylocystis sp.]